ncbi:ImcF-related family protein [Chimaeribacter arupi]|uniref:ImcF-related family protein n=1 Tax=Chimaeribacter arupi TaxID=2060066 RepID=UPI003CE59BD0
MRRSGIMIGKGNIWRLSGLLLFITLIGVATAFFCFFYAGSWGWADGKEKLKFWLYIMLAALLFLTLFFTGVSFQQRRIKCVTQKVGEDLHSSTLTHKQTDPLTYDIKSHLRTRYHRLWRYKVRLLWVMGEEAHIAAIAPGLKEKQWLEGDRTVLIYGGSPRNTLDKERLSELRTLRRSRPLDGIVLALTHDQATPSTLDTALRTLEQVGESLHYQPVVYLWQVCDTPWSQDEREAQPVGALFPARATPEIVSEQLTAMLPLLREQGMQQVCDRPPHDFLLRLGQCLKEKQIAHWKTLLTPWLKTHLKRVPLRGLMFSLPLSQKENAEEGGHEHAWGAPAIWQGVLTDCTGTRGVWVGLPWQRTLGFSLLGIIALCAAGSLISFAVNRQQMISAAAQAQQLVHAVVLTDEHLIALHALRNDIGRLQQREKEGAPWYQRVGLNHNQQLLQALLPWYGAANNRLIRNGSAQRLHAELDTLAALPPGSPQRAQRAKPGYDQLKAYLMMTRPEKADAAFYMQVMKNVDPARKGLSPALWQSLAPDLWAFYMQNLPSQPTWKITSDGALVAQARRVLLEQIGQRNAESTLYENMLVSVRRNYADMTLEAMAGDTDARRLFATQDVVPGMFTRQAWEGGIQEAIDKAVASHRDEIDWVLSDNRKSVSVDISPDALKNRLTERYFIDFAGAWLGFLNSLSWNPVQNLSDVTDQLTLMSDVRQSPLIALMNTLAYQGQAGRQREALSASLMKSAKDLLGKEEKPVIDQRAAGPAGPLDSTFGPLLTLMGKNSTQTVMAADSSLSLQTYLTRVTRVRLKLQQVANAPDPQTRMQQLAQTVFQGKSVDLTDTQEYGSLIAASLGEEWNGFGQAMFVQPLSQAWETVLQPSAASLNDVWQRAVVTNWASAFTGRYPFAAGKTDVSLPMLAEFIRRDTGRIDRFLTTQLGGVLHKEGSTWVVDETSSQGLTFNPAFLKAINQLSQLSDILFTDGSQGISFEMQGVAMPGIVETQLTLDGQLLHYFNQLPAWQSLRWPGVINKPGAMLTWTDTDAGARLFADHSGAWGFIRWLEQTRREKVGDGLYRLTLTTPDNRQVQWLLRTALGDGPLALLKLRNFMLPAEIFRIETAALTPAEATPADTMLPGIVDTEEE